MSRAEQRIQRQADRLATARAAVWVSRDRWGRCWAIHPREWKDLEVIRILWSELPAPEPDQ